MAYSADTFTSLEQPTLAKWNKLWTNDAYFNTQVGANFGSGTTSTVWWEELGRTTLGSTADSVSLTPIAARKHLKVLIYLLNSGAINRALRFNNDSGTSYNFRYSTNGAADTATGTQAQMDFTVGSTAPSYSEIDILNISSVEKICFGQTVAQNSTGVGNVVDKWDSTGKWVNTSSLITRIDVVNTGAGDYLTGSELIVLGHD